MVDLQHEPIHLYYERNYNFVRHYGFSLTELESMLPYERDAYLRFIRQEVERKRIHDQQQRNR